MPKPGVLKANLGNNFIYVKIRRLSLDWYLDPQGKGKEFNLLSASQQHGPQDRTCDFCMSLDRSLDLSGSSEDVTRVTRRIKAHGLMLLLHAHLKVLLHCMRLCKQKRL